MAKDKITLFFPKLEEFKDYHYPPISLLAVAAPLVKNGIVCEIIDQRLDNYSLNKLNKSVSDSRCVLITAYTGFQVEKAYEISKYIRINFPDKIIIWGGPHSTLVPEQVINSEYVDIVYWGYAEISIVQLINAVLCNSELNYVPNIYYKDEDNRIICTDKITTIKQEDFCPLPYGLVDILKYINPNTKRFIYISSYGCPGICTFCATKTKRKWTTIDIDKIEKDIDSVMSYYRFEQCVFFDSTIFTLKDRALELSKIMKKYNLNWIADGRSQEIYNLSEEDIRILHENGLIQIAVGLESGSENVISIMKKGKDHLKKYKASAKRLSKFSIRLVSGVIFGVPGETIDDLKETILYIKEIKKYNPNFFISTTFFRPLPDTVLYDTVKDFGYHLPESLEEWVKTGQSNHHRYNEWMVSPWMTSIDVELYKKIYDDFVSENKELFI